jgi:hypothetical protein
MLDSTTPLDDRQDATTMNTTRRLKVHSRRLQAINKIDSLGYARYEHKEESIVVDCTISAQESRAFNLSSLLRRERRSDRLLAVCSGRN